MAYIRRLLVENCRNVRHLDLDLSPAPGEDRPFLHLILTGPNGSGKSGVLEAIQAEIEATPGERSDAKNFWRTLLKTNPEHPAKAILARRSADLSWSRRPELGFLRDGSWFWFASNAHRRLEVIAVDGPKKLELGLGETRRFSPSFGQFLTNLKTEQAFAGVDGDQQAVESIGGWFEKFREHIGVVIEDPDVQLDFDRTRYEFSFIKSDGFRFSLAQLSDGASAVLDLLAELMMRVAEIRKLRKEPTFEPSGVVLIDEIEAHLHLKLQEAILPFLTGLFPKIQFIVATHSPAVIASIPGAMVHDLGSHTTTRSEEFRGKNFGTLMTGHFRTSSDLDLDTTEKLRRYRELAGKGERSPEEERERLSLRGLLGDRSQALAVELWMADGSPAPEGDDDPA